MCLFMCTPTTSLPLTLNHLTTYPVTQPHIQPATGMFGTYLRSTFDVTRKSHTVTTLTHLTVQ